MPLSWNEIRHRAIGFSREWATAVRERSESQTFWNEFFLVFGFPRKKVALFEEPVKKLSGEYGYIDLIWPGTLLVEHKSFGQDLSKAESQAFRYARSLNQEDSPRYIIVSDFARISLHDLEEDKSITFPLTDFHKHIHDFAFMSGYQQHTFQDQDPINIEAVEIMGKLHDVLGDGGYSGHKLERFLVRILFCLFAEDTGIFEREEFHFFIRNSTSEDGSDLGNHLARLFDVLNTPKEKRQKNLDESLADLPYVNGELFAENLGFADFNSDMRNALLACTRFDWSKISPAIFGSLFQAVMEPKERRQIGAHYTSERDILKVVRSLFLDDLRVEFEGIKRSTGQSRKSGLKRFHEKICALRFLDPACGCGNFLVITYRELRELELETLRELHLTGTGEAKGFQQELTLEEVNRLSLVDVDQLYGIELKEWPVRIAEVALWLMDHQMNIKVSETFGQLYQRLPLKKRPNIVQGNALRMDWKEVIPPEKCSYILGNPPFVGAMYMEPEQRHDMLLAANNLNGVGVLDYVSAWYFVASGYVTGTKIRVGFVSTNSITQGEQAGILWSELFNRGVKIHFAHRPFAWDSEARGKAHVHVVIIGFGVFDIPAKIIFDYDANPGKPILSQVRNINPYLVEGMDICIRNRSEPICNVPKMAWGSQPRDGGNFLMSSEGKKDLLRKEPAAIKWIRPFMGAEEFLNGVERWCLWLVGIQPQELNSLVEVKNRVEGVKQMRLSSKAEATRKKASTPTLFAQIAQPNSDYLLVPLVSSERRSIIPFGFMSKEVIASNLCCIVSDATPYHFGILSSSMHMAWVRQICGRLESRYRYSKDIVYNNYPWPQNPTDKQKVAVEEAAQNVLDVRKEYSKSTLADLYDPLSMPPKLVKAHANLDRVVDLCYRKESFTSERQRVEYLFNLYERLTEPLVAMSSRKKRTKT